MNKIRCALIGPGNIGTDLLYKLRRSDILEPVWMVGVEPSSEGLARARELGLKTTSDGIDGLLPLDWDGRSDSLYHAFDREGRRHMEYLRERGEYADVPLERMQATWSREYPHLGIGRGGIDGDFEKDVEAERPAALEARPRSR